MGMQIMNYRARMIGGSLKVETGGNFGVTITCLFPLPEAKIQMEEGRS
jgi:signal transduction histidine kinase